MDSGKFSLDEMKKKEQNRFRFDLKRVGQVIGQPRVAFVKIVEEGKKTDMLTPVLFVSILVLAVSLVTAVASAINPGFAADSSMPSSPSSSASGNSFVMGGGFSGGMPGGMGGMPGGGMMPGMTAATAEETTEDTGTTSQADAISQVVTISLTVVAALAGFLITWASLGILSNLFAVGFGGQGNARMAMVVAGWASVPVGIRSIMQLIYMLATNTAINKAGLSGFAPTSTTTLSILLQQALAQIDIYFFWQAALLMLGVSAWSGLTRKKSILVILFCVLLVLLVQAGLGLGIEKLSTISINTGMLGGFMR